MVGSKHFRKGCIATARAVDPQPEASLARTNARSGSLPSTFDPDRGLLLAVDSTLYPFPRQTASAGDGLGRGATLSFTPCHGKKGGPRHPVSGAQSWLRVYWLRVEGLKTVEGFLALN